MPELRLDPIQKRWVIIADERAKRPSEYQVVVTQAAAEFCPLCPGNEDKTPPEILVVRDGYGAPNSPGWAVRVVPNKYPALRIEGELDRCADGIYDRMNGIGAHEIVIETARHDESMADQSVAHLARVIRAYRDRVRDLAQDPRFAYTAVFKNFGESAGATLAHPHAQLIAMPIVPQVIQTELSSATEHYTHKRRCLFCDILRHECADERRLVCRNARYVAVAPYASRSPFELMILPTSHHHEFLAIEGAEIDDLAALLRDVLRRLRAVLNDPPYNFVIHASPSPAGVHSLMLDEQWVQECFHWHIEIIPRLSKAAGFEWGTGFHINPTPPEVAAEFLKGASTGQ